MIQRSRLHDPELAPCSSESDDDNSAAMIDETVERMFSQSSDLDRVAPTMHDDDLMLLYPKTRRILH
jgi:hypothetical protein